VRRPDGQGRSLSRGSSLERGRDRALVRAEVGQSRPEVRSTFGRLKEVADCFAVDPEADDAARAVDLLDRVRGDEAAAP
jgi:hypothetical protein